MEPTALPLLLGLATLLPLASFFLLLLFGPRMGQAGRYAAHLATGAIAVAGVLSFLSLFIWLGHHPPAAHDADPSDPAATAPPDSVASVPTDANAADAEAADAGERHTAEHDDRHEPIYVAGEYYTLGVFGKLRLTIGYYIDSLTLCMFCLVTVIATCIHIYAMGYMHEELHDVTDHEVSLRDGSHLPRPGRYPRFFQFLSLFCFSMLGLVLAGNIAMVFVFWELVGICSYFLIGFYIERPSACRAANKAFITNRVGDFGMIIGLMALWTGLGTFNFGDTVTTDADGHRQQVAGMFHLVRSGEDGALQTPAGFEQMVASSESVQPEDRQRGGYWLLTVAGIGIFCGCIGKSAQFPLHVWLPDAMEGPTPVSALVHSATMVAAGVYLVGRFYPVFTPEVLLVIAIIGGITLFMAATIAITATDIKRVLAYSTVSQLGYMMLALGVGGWLAGLLHLITHAFFKSLLFLCSGSVIHAVHTNEMPLMGGLRKKMPITAYTMLVGCLAISGISIPFLVGFSGYYSKDRILEQAYVFQAANASILADLVFYAAAGGAAITAFYMFRLWYLTFAGQPRDEQRYRHAHESPRVMTAPLLLLAFFATTIAWQLPAGLGWLSDVNLANLLEQSRPLGMHGDTTATLVEMTWPDEHFAHQPEQHAWVVVPITWLATLTAWAGIALATAMYWRGVINPAEVRKQFEPLYQFLVHKWWFDELYDRLLIRPTLAIGRRIAGFDRRWIDGAIDGLARFTRAAATVWDRVADRTLIDGSIDTLAAWTYGLGLRLRGVQTGRLRQYVMFIVIGAVALFVVISFFWSPSLAR